MHILQVTPYFHPHFGGVESHVLGLALELQKRGHTVDIVTSRYGRMPAREEVQGLQVTRLVQWLNLFNTPMVTGLPRHIARSAAEVVHVHSPPPFTERGAAEGCRRSGKPLVVTHHCDLELRGPLGRLAVWGYRRFLARFPLKVARHVIATTESYAATSRNLWSTEVEVIPNAVDPDRFHPRNDGEPVRRQYGIGDEPLALFVGRLVPHKGVDTLIEALSYLDHGHAMVVGDGPHAQALRRCARQLGVGRRVTFAGPVADRWLPSYYAAADTVVLPSSSRLEAFGIVGLEGMASGKPLVLSNIPGVRDVITDEEGRQVDPLDPDGLAGALEWLWDYPERARSMGRRGRQRVEEQFAWPIVAENVERVLASVVA